MASTVPVVRALIKSTSTLSTKMLFVLNN